MAKFLQLTGAPQPIQAELTRTTSSTTSNPDTSGVATVVEQRLLRQPMDQPQRPARCVPPLPSLHPESSQTCAVRLSEARCSCFQQARLNPLGSTVQRPSSGSLPGSRQPTSLSVKEEERKDRYGSAGPVWASQLVTRPRRVRTRLVPYTRSVTRTHYPSLTQAEFSLSNSGLGSTLSNPIRGVPPKR